MHEMSLCEGLRRVIEDHLAGEDVTRVQRVRLEVGRFAGVETRAMRFAFDVVMRGSAAEGAELVILDLPGRALCYDCAREVEIDDRLAPCPDCGGGRLMPVAGDELRLRDLEVI